MVILEEFKELLIDVEASMRDALGRLNSTPHLIQLVIKKNGTLLGMITDGDVRRALVNGANLDDPVERWMHIGPITARSVEEALAILPDVDGRRRCVPVVDGAHCIVSVVSDSPDASGLENAVIMAGGFGRRYGDITRDTPKPLLPVAGRPILWHIIRDMERHGIRQIFISIHYLGDKIRDFVNGENFGSPIEFIEENEPRGTAGALGLLPEGLKGPVLVINGDIITRVDFSAMLVQHQSRGSRITVGASTYDVEVPFGVLDVDGDGNLNTIREKPRYDHLVAAGIYIIDASLCYQIPKVEPYDMPALIHRAIQEEQRVSVFPIHEYWMDLGRPHDIRQAENEKLEWLTT